jgi:aminoglycoside phosphotransferase (APT) family kinase protein
MDPALATEAIEAQFPELSPVRMTYLGEGCDSTAFEVNGEWVFRFPKTDDVEAQLDIEARILPALAEQLPIAIPRFRFHGVRSASLRRRFCGYPKLPGVPAIRLEPDRVRLDALVEPLARFLSALHAFPVEAAVRACVPRQQLGELIEEIELDARGDLEAVSRAAPGAPVDRWQRFLQARPDTRTLVRSVLVHNDFAAEHVLVEPAAAAITGVIDWSDIAVSSPAADFAGIFHWGGEPFARAVLRLYGGELDADGLVVARYMAACRGAMDVSFGLETGRPEYVGSGIRALHLSAGG